MNIDLSTMNPAGLVAFVVFCLAFVVAFTLLIRAKPKIKGSKGSAVAIGQGNGFNECTGVFKCKANGQCSSDVFCDCFASNSKTADYACADTSAGGFNNTANPSA